jgi:Zn-dependent M28 family amino/carboxypeptidase
MLRSRPLFLAVALLFAASPLLRAQTVAITARELREHVTYLASDDLRGRMVGTEGCRKAAQYIATQFRQAGLAPFNGQSFYQTFQGRTRQGQPFQSENVIGILEGSDPKLKEEAIVIGCHYDHLGVSAQGDVFNGADDDASGVAVMLELAQAFGKGGARPKRTLLFIAFSGEEQMFVGSSHYVRNPARPLSKTVLMVNLEILGAGTTRQVNVMILDRVQPPVRAALTESAKAVGLEYIDGKDQFLRRGDQFMFFNAKVPILCMHRHGDHPNYHKVTDTADKLDYQWMETFGRMTQLILEKCANNPDPIRPPPQPVP